LKTDLLNVSYPAMVSFLEEKSRERFETVPYDFKRMDPTLSTPQTGYSLKESWVMIILRVYE
jgi:hypothetical protein